MLCFDAGSTYHTAIHMQLWLRLMCAVCCRVVITTKLSTVHLLLLAGKLLVLPNVAGFERKMWLHHNVKTLHISFVR